MKFRNASGEPQVFYGLHMVEGVAEYTDEKNGSRYRIMLGEKVLKEMDPTYTGKPVYVRHVEEVNWARLREEADGYVVESFFNQPDGKHWVKFIVVSDAGLEAVEKGWFLSNSYEPTPGTLGPGGKWHGVDYKAEVTAATYDHLAIVPNPRYQESVILTPEQFKQYNEDKLAELAKFSNADDEIKPEGQMKKLFEMFKHTKVDNSADLMSMSVMLPTSKQVVSIEKLLNDADAGYASAEHKVKLHDGTECTVGELVEKHKNMCNELAELKKPKEENADLPPEETTEETAEGEQENEVDPGADEEAKKELLKLAEHEEEEIEAAKKKNAASIAKLRNELGLEPRKPKGVVTTEGQRRSAALRNAEEVVTSEEAGMAAPVLQLSSDRVALGQSRYGSGKK